MQNQEQQWAYALKKDRRQTARQSSPAPVQEQQLKEELKYFKSQLRAALTGQNTAMAPDHYLLTLFNLRARQAATNLQKSKENYGFVPEFFLRQEIKKYWRDCQRLLYALKTADKHA